VKLERKEERLEREEEETLAKLLRLRKQRKFLRTRGKEMLRRGLQTLDELDMVEEQERQEADRKEKALEEELREQQARASSSSDFIGVLDGPSFDPTFFSEPVFGVDQPLLSSFWESLGFSGETSQAPQDT
jgi:hypothetical protein